MTFTFSGAEAWGVILDGILYGAYVVLFVLYLVLRRRNSRGFDGPLILAQILLFGLCTVSLCLDIPMAYFFVVPNVENLDTAMKLDLSSIVVFTITDYLAQMILLYRCWIVWGGRWAVVAVPGFLALVWLGGGFAAASLVNSPLRTTGQDKDICIYAAAIYSISLVANALITLLIVTKIFLSSRKICPVLGSDFYRSLRVITAIVIESGFLMFAFQLIIVVLFSIQHPAAYLVSLPICQIYGITATLLNIRVVMGSTYDQTTEQTRSLRFARSETAATQTTLLGVSAAGVQSQGMISELDDVSNNNRGVDDTV